MNTRGRDAIQGQGQAQMDVDVLSEALYHLRHIIANSIDLKKLADSLVKLKIIEDVDQVLLPPSPSTNITTTSPFSTSFQTGRAAQFDLMVTRLRRLRSTRDVADNRLPTEGLAVHGVRLAIKEQSGSEWIVGEIDRKYNELLAYRQLFEHIHSAESGYFYLPCIVGIRILERTLITSEAIAFFESTAVVERIEGNQRNFIQSYFENEARFVAGHSAADMRRKLSKIESNHARVIEDERRRYEERIERLTDELTTAIASQGRCQRVASTLPGLSDGMTSSAEEALRLSVNSAVRHAQYQVAVMADVTPSNKSPTSTLAAGKPILSMTVLYGEVYVARSDLTDLEIYDAVSVAHPLLRRHHIAGIGCATDMAACHVAGNVYVADQLNRFVHRIKVERNANIECDRWSVGEGAIPVGLFVNSASNLLVTCFRSAKIFEMTSTGERVREIHLQRCHPDDSVLHAVEICPGRLAVIVNKGTSERLGKLSVIDANTGHEMHSYGGSDSQLLDSPVQLATCGFVFVADFRNHRVLRLSPTLETAREMATGLNWPLRICLDEDNMKLFVAENKLEKGSYVAGHISVYSMGTR